MNFFSATKVIKVSKLLINSFNIFRSKVPNFLLCQYRPDFTVIILIFLPSCSQKKHHFMSSLVKNLAAVSSEARLVLIGLYFVQVS